MAHAALAQGLTDATRARQPCGPPSCSYAWHSTVERAMPLRSPRARAVMMRVSAAAQSEVMQLPQSREAAVGEAAAAAVAALQDLLSSKAQSFRGGQRKLALEIPVADDSPEGVSELANEFVNALPNELRSGLSVITNSEVTRLAQKRLPRVNFVSLAERRLPPTSRSVLLVGLGQQEISDVRRLLSNTRAEVVILLNTSDRAAAIASNNFVAGFDIAYCFEPIAIKAFVLTTDGVVYKNGADAPWLILKRSLLGKFKSIGRMQTRPQQRDLEAAFLNAAAVDSPVNKGIGAIKNLVSRKL